MPPDSAPLVESEARPFVLVIGTMRSSTRTGLFCASASSTSSERAHDWDGLVGVRGASSRCSAPRA
jgi:hypothetical protein